MTMADLNTLIAQGPPRMDFSPLSTLFDSYGEGQKARRQQDVWDARRQAAVTGADGRPDYGATARNLLDKGDIEGARQVAAMAKDMRWAATGAAPDNPADENAAALARLQGPSPTAGTTSVPVAPPPWTPSLRTRDDINRLIQHARDAVAQGADRGEVLQRLRRWGVNFSGI
jgi:hypothetical protein